MMASNNSDTARYTYRNISPDFKHVYKRYKCLCINVYKRIYINIYKRLCLNVYKRLPTKV